MLREMTKEKCEGLTIAFVLSLDSLLIRRSERKLPGALGAELFALLPMASLMFCEPRGCEVRDEIQKAKKKREADLENSIGRSSTRKVSEGEEALLRKRRLNRPQASISSPSLNGTQACAPSLELASSPIAAPLMKRARSLRRLLCSFKSRTRQILREIWERLLEASRKRTKRVGGFDVGDETLDQLLLSRVELQNDDFSSARLGRDPFADRQG